MVNIMYDQLFIESLKTKNYKTFKKVPKGDLHVHGILGSNRTIFKSSFGIKLPIFKTAKDFNNLTEYIRDNIVPLSNIKNNHIKLIELAIKTAINDGVTKIDLSVDYRTSIFQFDNDISSFINILKKIKDKYEKNNITINFDLGISRNNFKNSDVIVIKQLILLD